MAARTTTFGEADGDTRGETAGDAEFDQRKERLSALLDGEHYFGTDGTDRAGGTDDSPLTDDCVATWRGYCLARSVIRGEFSAHHADARSISSGDGDIATRVRAALDDAGAGVADGDTRPGIRPARGWRSLSFGSPVARAAKSARRAFLPAIAGRRGQAEGSYVFLARQRARRRPRSRNRYDLRASLSAL